MQRFYELWGEIADLEITQEILMWDQETMMPPAGHPARRSLLTTLAATRHRLLSAPELTDVVAEALATTEPDGLEERQLQLARKEIDRTTKIPEDLARALAGAASDGVMAWRAAREEASFGRFAPHLEKLVALRREEAAALALGPHPYDSLLDAYEPGMRTDQLVPIFDELATALADVVARVVDSGIAIDETAARGHFPAATQLAFGRWTAAEIGFDFERGRLDLSTHPFCAGFAPSDVRITWRRDESDFRPALFGILHEAGHGLYEQGLPVELGRTPAGFARSMGMHESQSRLWENMVGRHRGFWEHVLPRFREAYPDWRGEVDSLLPALHRVRPTLIRVEADEVTYNLHILVRFRLELALLTGELAPADLPGAWDDGYEELLGIRPDSVVDGVLQDIHWSEGLLGYFPTYTLGSLLSAQLFAAAQEELGDLGALFREGDFAALLGWLRDRIHRHGSSYSTDEITRRATGRSLEAGPFLRYVDEKLATIYGIAPAADAG